MLNNFIYAQTKDLFLEQLNAGNILDEAIVFIEDTKEIWNHGTYFGGGSGSEIDSELLSEIQTAVAQLESNKLDKTDAESTYAKKAELPDISGYITKTTADGLYATIGATQSLQEEIDDLETVVAGKADSSALSEYATTGALTEVSDRVADIEGLIAADSDAVINKWDEVVTFLDGISDSNDLEGLLAAKANSETVTDLATTVSNLTTTDVAEGSTNLYFTDSRARSAITGGASTIAGSNLTASRALISNSSGKVAVSDVTSTELSYLDGVTSNIQTQLNGKASSDLATTVNTMKTKLDGITDSADSVSFSKNLTSGTKIGTITINGTGTDLYCQTNTDTKVTSAANHYTPTAESGSQLSVDASSSTAASWNSTSLVTGVNIQRDSKGHVTGVTVDSIKMPANPNTDTNTTYSAGTGLSLSGTTFSHADTNTNISSDTSYGPTTNVTQSAKNTATFKVPQITLDQFGHVKSVTERTITVTDTDTNTDTNTHYTTRIYAGASGTAANAAASNPYLKVTDDNTYRNQIQFKGSGATAVSSDANGVITISSTDTNTNTWRGITDSVSTTDSTISGSATAVKTAYDKAVSAYNLANGKTDTKNTAGSTNSTSKLFLIGATSQAENPVTYSNSGVYATSGTMYATAYYETSDERLKNFKEDIKVDFDKLKLIPKKYFTWKHDETQMLQIGTSAQAVQAIYPELVSNDTILHVDYARLVIPALAAIDVLYEENKLLKDKIIRLEEVVYGN